MTTQVTQALRVYLTQRWTIPALLALTTCWGLMLFATLQDGGKAAGQPVILVTIIGMPTMVTAFWVTAIAKWQFVNPRARLTPGFAGPHLAVIAGWLATGLIGCPLIVSLVAPGFDRAALAASGLASGALFIWAMHTGRPLYTLIAMACYFSPLASATHAFWISSAPVFLFARSAVAVAGLAGIAGWLWQLARLTEESENYTIPTQAQSGKASRMEKSEARRNLALQLSRSKVAEWVIDQWHDRLGAGQSGDAADPNKLLRYGFAPIPDWVRTLWMVGIIGLIITTTCLMSGDARLAPTTALPTSIMLAFLGPAMASQLLAGRRPRMQTEVLAPLARRDYLRGLFLALGGEALVNSVATAALLALLAAWVAPDLLTAEHTIGALLLIASGSIAAFAVATLTALIESGFKRMLILITGLYTVIGVLATGAWLYKSRSVTAGVAITIAVLVIGAWLARVAFRRWMRAELG